MTGVTRGDPSDAPPLEKDPRADVWETWPGSVLLNDEIEYYSTAVWPPLLEHFESEQLKPARYQLRLGGEARIDGVVYTIDDKTPLVIRPHQVAIVQTYERLNIPRFLIGRWNLRVDMVYRGLLWVGALQVDPGWRGYLPCPLYNMSDKEVELQFKEPVFTIDFVRTTRFTGKSKPYQMKFAPNPPISKFDTHRLRSGPYDVLAKVDTMARDVADLKKHLDTFITFITAALAVVVAAIGVIAAAPREIAGQLSTARALTLGAAIFAVVIALAAFNQAMSRREPFSSGDEHNKSD